VDVIHHVVCRHRVEVEVWPPRAEVSFRDERAANPIDTQVRFEAAVVNATTPGVSWDVRGVNGGPGAGSIDAAGLYRAPQKGALPNGFTDVVVATSLDDPLRKAYAWVTLVGVGPAPDPQPRIALVPETAHVYYPQDTAGSRNEFIDASNNMQLFKALVWNTPGQLVDWLVDGAAVATLPSSVSFRYVPPTSGSDREVAVRARLTARPTVHDDGKLMLINYRWPRMELVGNL
jgi:hypothetical protein